MALILGKIKCCFCGKINGVIQSVHGYGIYGEDINKRIFFHDKCLEMVEYDPEKFGNSIVDIAIYINELKKKNLEENSSIEKTFKKKVETLQKNHFERMMPKKMKG